MKQHGIDAPASALEKRLHYEKTYNKKSVATLLGLSGQDYAYAMEKPHIHITVEMMEKLSILLECDVLEVFWLCYRRDINLKNAAMMCKVDKLLEKIRIERLKNTSKVVSVNDK